MSVEHATATVDACPGCGEELPGLGRYCANCDAYTSDLRAGGGEETPEPTLPESTEEEVQRAVVHALRTLGWAVYDTAQGFRPDGSTRITAGLSDLICFRPGRVAFVEVKCPGGQMTEAQESFRETVLEAGAEHHVVRSAEEAVALHEGSGPGEAAL